MIKNLRHVGLVVSDMDRAIKFYQGLGCKVISRSSEIWGNIPLVVCKMTHGIELILGQWCRHFAVTVDSFDCLKSKYVIYSKLDVRFITDPDGNVIELVKEDDL